MTRNQNRFLERSAKWQHLEKILQVKGMVTPANNTLGVYIRMKLEHQHNREWIALVVFGSVCHANALGKCCVSIGVKVAMPSDSIGENVLQQDQTENLQL